MEKKNYVVVHPHLFGKKRVLKKQTKLYILENVVCCHMLVIVFIEVFLSTLKR